MPLGFLRTLVLRVATPLIVGLVLLATLSFYPLMRVVR